MPDRLLTVDETGGPEYLASGPRFVRGLIAQRKIRFVRVGGRKIRIPESAVAEYVAKNTVEASR
jgi:excisionase family DNA binding protein